MLYLTECFDEPIGLPSRTILLAARLPCVPGCAIIYLLLRGKVDGDFRRPFSSRTSDSPPITPPVVPAVTLSLPLLRRWEERGGDWLNLSAELYEFFLPRYETCAVSRHEYGLCRTTLRS
jgi:hypothetical protein